MPKVAPAFRCYSHVLLLYVLPVLGEPGGTFVSMCVVQLLLPKVLLHAHCMLFYRFNFLV